MSKLTQTELNFLDWLSKEDLNAFGECHGSTLDGLVMAGLAIIMPGNATAGYAVVSISDKGRQILKTAGAK